MSAEGQIKAYFQRWERLEGEKKAISDDLKELFKEAKSLGFDGKALRVAFNRKAKLDEGDPANAQFEMTVDTYLDALNGSPRDARLRTRENIEEFDAETGEVRDVNPRLIQQVVTGMQTETGRAALIAAVDIMIEREEAEPEFHTNPEEEAEAKGAATDDAEDRGEGDTDRQRSPEPGKTDGGKQGAREQVGSPPVPDFNSPIAPASQGEAEVPSVESVSPETHGSSDANTGGEDVTLEQNAAPIQAGALVSENTPATPMRRTAFAHCFPELTNQAYGDLRDSIIAIGISEPIVRKGDVILDGFCRYNIARSLGLKYPVEEYAGDDALLDVIRWQRSSRDWTPQQEAKIAKALAAEVPARAEEIFAAFHIAELPDGEVVAA